MTVHFSMTIWTLLACVAAYGLFRLSLGPLNYMSKFVYATHNSKHVKGRVIFDDPRYDDKNDETDPWGEMPKERKWAEITGNQPALLQLHH